MKKISRKPANPIWKFSGIALALFLVLTLLLPAAYAAFVSIGNVATEPDVLGITITAGEGGDKTGKTLEFRGPDGLPYTGDWYPGLELKSVVRLYNGGGLQTVTLANLGVGIQSKDNPQIFADNMRLTIKQGQNPDFATTLYEGTLSGIQGSATSGGKDVNLTIPSSGFTDLQYTLSMDEEAGADTQGLNAQLAFYFNMNNIPLGNGGDGDNGGGDTPAPNFLLEQRNWYDDCIEALIAHNIIIPDIDGEIRPNELITRGEAAVLLGRALGLKEDNGPTGYLDAVPERYRGYVNATTKAGVFKGYPLITESLPGRVFKANNFITREELFCVLVRAYNVKQAGELELDFIDRADISGWALGDIKSGVQNKVIGGYPDNSLKPQQSISRAEAFTLVCRLQGYHAQHDVAVGGAGQ